jgi:hypothetical protein
MYAHLDISRRFLVLWYVSIRAYRRREDMCVHAFCPLVAKFRFIVVTIESLVLLLPTDDAEPA